LHQRTFAEPSLWRPRPSHCLPHLYRRRACVLWETNKQTKCAGIHRSLGTHISKVKSATLDKWTDEQIDVRPSYFYSSLQFI
jgi:hypothetical protein